jgi:hypothetical protein
MTTDRGVRADLEPDAPEALLRLAARLEHERPAPGAAFRGELGRRLARAGAPRPRPRPPRLHALIAACASAGLALLLIGAASAAGWGPLAA